MFKRIILKPITLSDGTYLPADFVVEMPSAALARDPSIVPGDANPNIFDGFRFSRLRATADREDAAKYLFAAISIDGGMHFGFGRRACPGRFFTTNLMKLVLAHLITEYDIKMTDEENGELKRYENLHVEATNFVDGSKNLLFRKKI